MAITFEVAEVEPGSKRLDCVDVGEAIRRLIGAPSTQSWEAVAQLEGGVHAAGIHPFVAAVQLAYDLHLPLRLSPDQVWLVIAQGFANHVRLNSEALRHQFVSHQDQVLLKVRRDDFVRGTDNPWSEVFGEFAEQMREHIGKRHDLIVAKFSTTGPVERTVSQLVLMDAMQSYFDYMLVTRCGIPRITLTGTISDWRSVHHRAQALREFGLGDWLDALVPILEGFVDASAGRVDLELWKTICKREHGSGGPYFSGWIGVLFPYLLNYRRQLEPSPHLDWRAGMCKPLSGPSSGEFPSALASVPMIWNYGGQLIDMQLLGGFVGVQQHPDTREVTPALGWAVREL